jgi:hypothetical protein
MSDFVIHLTANIIVAKIARRGRACGPLSSQAARRRAAILGEELMQTKPFKLVAVALANKMARIAFAIMRGRTTYGTASP